MSRLKCTAHMDSPSNRLLLRPIFDVGLNFVVDFVREVHHVFSFWFSFSKTRALFVNVMIKCGHS